MSQLVIVRGRLQEDPSIASHPVTSQDGTDSYNEVVVTVDVELDSVNQGAKPERRQFVYTEKDTFDAQNDMKKVANSLVSQIMHSKKGNKVFIQVNQHADGTIDNKIYSYFDQLTQTGRK